MKFRTPPRQSNYHPVARWLHWIIAGLLLAQYVLAELAELAEHNKQLVQQLALLANHKSLGITILVLVAIRIGWRLTHPVAPLANQPCWQKRLAHVTHLLIYGLIVLLPITGWLMSSASSYPVSWFQVWTLPDLVAADEALEQFFIQAHALCWYSLLTLLALHILATLKHQLIDHDGLFARMGSATWLVGSLLISAVAVTLLWQQPSTPVAIDNAVTKAAEPGTVSLPDSSLSPWLIDYPQSRLQFTGTQAGAEFSGRFTTWQADLRFDPDQLDKSRFEVSIDLASADTRDQQRDDMLRTEAFFAIARHPNAGFIATDFSRLADGSFSSQGELTIKGQRLPLRFDFTVQIADSQVLLTGRAVIDRIAFGIGTGEWLDTDWVGQMVEVDVSLTAALPD